MIKLKVSILVVNIYGVYLIIIGIYLSSFKIFKPHNHSYGFI